MVIVVCKTLQRVEYMKGQGPVSFVHADILCVPVVHYHLNIANLIILLQQIGRHQGIKIQNTFMYLKTQS